MSQFLPKSRQEIRRQIGTLMDKLTYGAALGATASSLTMEAIKRHPDHHFAGRIAFPVTGGATGQQRIIATSVQQDGVAFVEPDFTVTPAAGDLIEIWDEDLHPARVDNAINLAILDAQEIVNVPVRVNPVLVSPDRLELELPDDLTKVYGVGYRQSGTNTVYEHVDPGWTAEHQNGWTLAGRTLYLSPAPPEAITSTDLWIYGYRCPVELDTDASLCEVRPDFLIYMAAFFLESGEMGSQVTDPSQHGPRAATWIRQALIIRERMITSYEPNTVEVGP